MGLFRKSLQIDVRAGDANNEREGDGGTPLLVRKVIHHQS